MRRIVAAVAVAFLVLVIAVTPLSSTFQPGYFDLFLPSPNGDAYPVSVTVRDDTGLVTALVPELLAAQSASTRALSVHWEGDSDDVGIWMHFYAIDGGYRIDEVTTHGMARAIGTGIGRDFVLVLRAAVDPSLVRFLHD